LLLLDAFRFGDKLMNRNLVKDIRNNTIAFFIPIALFFLLVLLEPERVTSANIPILLSQAVLPSILALGLVCNLSVGNWDFALGAECVFTAILAGNIAATLNLGVVGLIVLCILVGIMVGVINGSLYLLLKVPTLITSIGFLLLLESVSALINNGDGYRGDGSLVVLGTYPLNYILFGIMFAFIFFLYNFRPFGARVRAIGKNPAVARLNGINVFKVKFMCMVLAGLFAGFYAFMYIGTNSTVLVITEMGTLSIAFDAMMCVFIGMSLSSLTNLIVGAFLGALLLQIIKLGLVVLHIPTELSQIVVAVFVVLFMAYSGRQSDIKKRLLRKSSQKAADIN